MPVPARLRSLTAILAQTLNRAKFQASTGEPVTFFTASLWGRGGNDLCTKHF